MMIDFVPALSFRSGSPAREIVSCASLSCPARRMTLGRLPVFGAMLCDETVQLLTYFVSALCPGLGQ